MTKVKSLITFFVTLLCLSCNSGGQSELIKFETVSGTITKPVTSNDLPYDSITLTYDIKWPVKGNAETVSLVRAHIISLVTGNSVSDEKNDIQDILNSIATKMAQDEGAFSKSIDVIADAETPFDSYLTIRALTEECYYMSRCIYLKEAVTIRLTDGKIFQGNNAIANEDMMKALITQHLIKAYQSEESDWLWSEHIMCEPYKVPIPQTPLSLTKDGVEVFYKQYEISDGSQPPFECVIPFDEVIYALTEEAQEFLNLKNGTTNETAKTESIKKPELDEESAISLIKKANLHKTEALSSDFKSIWKEEEVLFQYGAGADCVNVKNPDIKIFKIIPNEDGSLITVIFDYIDKDAPQMGWISKQDYFQKICAMDFIFENGQWVVDDYHEAWNSTVDKYSKDETSSKKSILREELEFLD